MKTSSQSGEAAWLARPHIAMIDRVTSRVPEMLSIICCVN